MSDMQDVRLFYFEFLGESAAPPVVVRGEEEAKIMRQHPCYKEVPAPVEQPAKASKK